MRLDIVTTEIIPTAHINPGTKDRRYKSGYRILPFAVPTVEVILHIRDPEQFLRYGMGIRIPGFEGRSFVVIGRNPAENVVTLKMVATDNFFQTRFVIPATIEFLITHYAFVGEGSATSKL